jgi:uncharacterized protein YxeA
MTEQKKGLGALAWVAIGCGVVVVIVVVVLIAGGLFVAHKVKQAGFDPELWQKNPAVAASKMITALNPDLEVVSVDEDKGLITVRNTKTGEEVTLNFEDVKNGRFSVQQEGKETVTVDTSKEGGEGTVKITSDEGTVVIGSGAGEQGFPDWVPVYPGAEVQSTYSATTGTEISGAVSQTTGDGIDQVMERLASQLKDKGYSVSTNSYQQNGATAGGMISAEDAEHGRGLQIILGAEDGSTTIAITYSEKKKQ